MAVSVILVSAEAQAAQAPQEPPAQQVATPLPEDEGSLDGRRRPGRIETFPPPIDQTNPGAVRAPPPEAFPQDQAPLPDRWRVVQTLGLIKQKWYDPYHQNALKGDIPLKGTRDWFLTINGVSDTVIEPRSFPTPVAPQTAKPGSLDTFGRTNSLVLSQTLVLGASLAKGSTAFKPPEIEARIALAVNYSYVQAPERRLLDIRPTHQSHRRDHFVGVQEAFVDYHLWNVSQRYDFDSVRVGIQPFSSDFRGFLFQDNQLGVRLYGDRDNNRVQYNLAWFRRLEKDTNSGLNDVGRRPRDDDVFIANLYRQDLPVPGLTSQVTLVWNRNREKGQIHFDDNGFPVRPALIGDVRTRSYDAVYIGYSADGHFGRINLTATAYGVVGEDRNSTFTGEPTKIRSWFAAVEPSYDFNWLRVRGSALYASGDNDPYDNKETGFDAIFENPQFSGADTSYWMRQPIPFTGGGRAVNLSGRNGLLNNLRSSKEEGQSNFNNPGTVLLGVGGDADITPQWRVSANLNHLWFANTAVVKALRQEGSVPKALGWDLSAAVIWRPKMTQNLVFRASGAVFDPGKGFSDLFASKGRDSRYYSVLLNAILTF